MLLNGKDLYKEIQDIINEDIETKLSQIIFQNYSKYDPNTMCACIAGGSVADRLYAHETGIEVPIKDVDIFIGKLWNANSSEEKKDEYNGVEFFINKKYNVNHYKIVEVKWDGKINIILVETFEPCLNEEEFAEYVIRGFDINCCQAAITMKNKNLRTTEDFDNFLKTKDLKVTNPHNMGSTALRIIKKEETLKLKTVNKEREFDIIVNAFFYYKNKIKMTTFLKNDNPKLKYLKNIESHFDFFKTGLFYNITPKEEKNILHLEKMEDKKSIFSFNRNLLTFDEIREMYERKKKEL